jgi:hypothetical protein
LDWIEGIGSKRLGSTIALGGTEFHMRLMQIPMFYIGLVFLVAALITVLAYVYPGPY